MVLNMSLKVRKEKLIDCGDWDEKEIFILIYKLLPTIYIKRS
jgi:hypothetical protein